MPLTEAANQKAFDAWKNREKQCLQWLKQLSRSVRKPVFYAAAAGLGNGVGIIVQAALLAFLLHALIIEQRPLPELSNWVVGLLALFAFRSLCVYRQQTLGFRAGAAIKREIRRLLAVRFEAQGPAYLKQQQSGELATAVLEQTEALENYFARYLPQQMIVGVLPLLMIAVVMPVNWVVGLIFLVTGPLVPVFMILAGMGAASANRSQFLALARMSGYFLDRLQGLATLKLFGRTEREAAAIRIIADQFRQGTMSVLRLAFLSSAVLEFFSAVAVGLVAVYVGLGLLGLMSFGPASGISLREALFVLLLTPEYFSPLRQLAVHYHDRAAAIGAVDHLLTVLDADTPASPIADDDPEGGHYRLECRGVDKTFGSRQVLTAIDFTIKAGEKVALVGESGAGKTTLLNLILGFEPPDRGRIRLDGQGVTRELAARHCAWVGQQTYSFVGTIRDNIALAEPSASDQAVAEAARAAGVDEFSERLPHGLETEIGEGGYGLSGGQMQRIALARAFLKPAPIVLLDEPSAHLDGVNKRLLLDRIEALFQDRTVIIASHDRAVIERMDRRLRLVHGKLEDA